MLYSFPMTYSFQREQKGPGRRPAARGGRPKGGPGKSAKKGRKPAPFREPGQFDGAPGSSSWGANRASGTASSAYRGQMAISKLQAPKPTKKAPGPSPIPKAGAEPFPMRINKYLSHMHAVTRKMADALIAKKQVKINGKVAELGDKVQKTDKVELAQKELDTMQKDYAYFAYNKPVGLVTHSAERDEIDIKQALLKNSSLPPHITKTLFPIGRLDKKSNGLIILTNDGRITDRLLNPEYTHDKEYIVSTVQELPSFFQRIMENGMKIGDYTTKPCKIKIMGPKMFSIVLTEGKRHQIRRMCEALHVDVRSLQRVRVMNIRLGKLASGSTRKIEGIELEKFLKDLRVA